jgi:hypothetical protein
MGGSCKGTGENGNAYNILVGKPEVKSPLGKLRFRWKYDAETRLIW